ncbi:hypothetical protein FB451DRAFT_1407870 [Mycena latifolia]|nr:hypothetical protein FB451DRAFT_1407870 [Mycena latifolia]
MRLVSVIHVSAALIWTVFAAPAHPPADLSPGSGINSGKATHQPVPASSGPSDIFVPLRTVLHTSAQAKASGAPELEPLELDQKSSKGKFENGCVIA